VKQTNYQVATDYGFERARRQTPEALGSLGVEAGPERLCRLPVLNAVFNIDLTERTVTFAESDLTEAREGTVGQRWEILALHYLCGKSVEQPPPAVDSHGRGAPGYPQAGAPVLQQSVGWASFADFPDARGYQSVYEARVVRRLCATAGRNRECFIAAAERLGGRAVPFGDVGYQFNVFPSAPVIVAWYEGDAEFPPNVSLLYPPNILELLPAEDVVVLSECLVSRLQGKGW